MKVCIVGAGYLAEKNTELYMNKHSVSIFVPYPITAEESMAFRQRTNCVPIYYDPTTLSTMDLFVICVDLPYNDIKKQVSMDRFLEVSQAIRRFAHPGSTVIVETRVSVGTTRKYFTGIDVHCSYSPSRITQDTTNTEITDKSVKLVGGLDEESEILAMQFLETIYKNVVRTGSTEVSEAVSMLTAAQDTVQEAMINEFSDFCDMVDVDIHQVIDAASVGNRGGTKDARVKLPWIGRRNDIDSRLAIVPTDDFWPVLSEANRCLTSRPTKIYKQIVDRYCKGNFDRLHKLSFLIVGLGTTIGSSDMADSPVLEIIRYLELEGAVVTKYDMFVEGYTQLPVLKYNSGKCKFDGILVMHPYLVQKWKGEFEEQTMYFCRH